MDGRRAVLPLPVDLQCSGMLFEFEDADFEPMSRFGLKWRWTSPSHAELPTAVVARIRPIAGEKAALISDFVHDRVFAHHPHHGLLNPEFAGALRGLRTLNADEGVVREWLLSLPIPVDQTVIVSWDRATAVTAPFPLIAEHWSDFFYPSSDDAAVIPARVEWMLAWHHEEAFEFGLARSVHFVS